MLKPHFMQWAIHGHMIPNTVPCCHHQMLEASS